MSGVTKEEILLCQETATQFSQLAMLTDPDVLNRYIKQIRPQIDGTMDAILPHFMSISDMRKAQGNGQFIVDVLEHILAIQKLVQAQVENEARAA